MATDDGRLVVVFNGEIYNYLELRDQLIGTRVPLPHPVGYGGPPPRVREWAPSCRATCAACSRSLADRARRELFIARDRFGEKPLFYTQHAGGVSFGSEMKVLAALPELRRDVDDESLAAFLCLNYVPGTATMLCATCTDCVRRPGTFGGRRLRKRRFLLVAAGPARGRPAGVDGEAAERLETLLRRLGAYRAPQRRPRRHLPIGRHGFVARRAERGEGGPAVGGGLLPDLR